MMGKEELGSGILYPRLGPQWIEAMRVTEHILAVRQPHDVGIDPRCAHGKEHPELN